MRVVVPAIPEGDTFEWVLPPDGDLPGDASWFIDGSLFDESKRFARRTGFGIAVVASNGSLLALGRGVPPAWVHDAAGAEVWAFFSAIRLNCYLPRVVTDCLGVLRSLQDGYQAAVGPNRRQARLWAMIGHSLDEDFSSAAQTVVWMPSHGAVHTIDVVKDSTGCPITPAMWRANRLADLLAKSAAEPWRLPRWITRQVSDMSRLVVHHAARLGVATTRANGHRVTVHDEQGVERTRVLRDSTAERPKWSLRPRKRAMACHVNCTSQTAPASTASLVTDPSMPKCSETRQRTVGNRKRQASRAPLHGAAKRARVHAIETIRQDVRDEEQLACWVRAYRAKPSTSQPAEERMAALRARVQQREQEARQEAACWMRAFD